MGTKMKSLIVNVFHAVFSNGIGMAISIVLTFILPKLMGVEEYGYYQLYIFYASYVGFLHLGWVDGIYLRYGGARYAKLNRATFASQFWVLNAMEIFVSAVLGLIVCFTVNDENKRYVLLITCLSITIVIAKGFVLYVLQATNRIREYAKYTRLEKYLIFAFTMVALLFGGRSFQVLLWVDIIAKCITVILGCTKMKGLLFYKFPPLKLVLREARKNISVGSKLMFSNIASMLIIGIVRMGIEKTWDITTFGKISLTMNISNLLMVFINAVGVVMFPMLRRTSKEKLPSIYAAMRTMLMVPVLGVLVAYYPAKMLLSAWLPQYAESLGYMALLFPMCIFESKMAMLINTYLKTLRKEKWIMLVNLSTVAFSLVATGITVFWLKNLTLAIVSIVVLLAFRCVCSEWLLSHYLNVRVMRDVVLELLLTIVFMTTGWLIDGYTSVLVYLACYLVYIVIKKKDIVSMVKMLRTMSRG